MSSTHLSSDQFSDIPYPRLREAYARTVVHHVGEARTQLNRTMRDTGLSFETLRQMAKSDDGKKGEKAFEIVSKNPHALYHYAHTQASLHALRYQMSDNPESKEWSKQELLFGFQNRHVAMKSPYFSELVN